MTKLRRDEEVSLTILSKIGKTLHFMKIKSDKKSWKEENSISIICSENDGDKITDFIS